jgi:hypothetical protein
MELKEFDRRHVDAILSDPTCLSSAASYLGLSESDLSLLISDDRMKWAQLRDAVIDAVVNEGPVIKEFLAEQSKGVYPINVAGVGGAYYVWAQEYDSVGFFDSIEQAIAYVQSEYGEFLIEGSADEGTD